MRGTRRRTARPRRGRPCSINLPRTLLDSAIFTGGVLLSTLVLGLLAGYALARLEFGGRGIVFNAMLLILIAPFQHGRRPIDVFRLTMAPLPRSTGGPPRRSPGPPRPTGGPPRRSSGPSRT